MDPIKSSSINHINHANLEKNRNAEKNGFQKTLKTLISQVDQQIKDAGQKTEEFAIGKRYNLHEIMIATEKSGISFKFLLQIRNKLLEAYQEIMRMNF
ncbi:MAG: flagellar hook-basal body complex protein FliE [Deltaproteobacteria bacterium]|nr:flagellar hook-basal body complex protein FliE [Deltaproteobacteria bacterium]